MALSLKSKFILAVIVVGVLNVASSVWRLYIYSGDDWMDGNFTHWPTQPDALRRWAENHSDMKPIIGVLPDGTRVTFANTDPLHTVEAALRCNQYVFQAMQKAGGPQWCVSYGCRCLVAPGSLIGNAGYNPKNGVLLDVY